MTMVNSWIELHFPFLQVEWEIWIGLEKQHNMIDIIGDHKAKGELTFAMNRAETFKILS